MATSPDLEMIQTATATLNPHLRPNPESLFEARRREIIEFVHKHQLDPTTIHQLKNKAWRPVSIMNLEKAGAIDQYLYLLLMELRGWVNQHCHCVNCYNPSAPPEINPPYF